MQYKPRPDQGTAGMFLYKRPAAALFFDPGMGKTSITLSAFVALRETNPGIKMVVFAPLQVTLNVWGREIEKWYEFNHLKYQILHGKNKMPDDRADVYLINYEGVKHFATKTTFRIDVLVFDELSKMKHTNTQRFKMMRSVVARSNIRWGLTGTPMGNSVKDLWAEMFCIDKGERLYPVQRRFLNEYFTDVSPHTVNYNEWKPKVRSEELIFDKIKDIVLRGDVASIKMPEVVYSKIEVILGKDAQAQHSQAMNELAITLNSGDQISFANAGVAAMKARQIASGALYTRDGEWTNIHDEKIQALIDLVDELQGAPLLVATTYKHEIERIKKAFPNAEFISGDSKTNATDIFDRWNEGKITLLVAQQRTISHGLNLQRGGRHVCWFSLPDSFEAYVQFNGRIYRSGNTNKTVMIYHIIAKDTIDERTLKTLDGRKRNQEELFRFLLTGYDKECTLENPHTTS